jgi:hypothetical protein
MTLAVLTKCNITFDQWRLYRRKLRGPQILFAEQAVH